MSDKKPATRHMIHRANAVYCLWCKTIIQSTHVHDFKYCACEDGDKKVFVDGGWDYIRRGYGKKAKWLELAIGAIQQGE